MNAFTYKIAEQVTACEELSLVEAGIVKAHDVIAKVRLPGFVAHSPMVDEREFGEDDVQVLKEVLVAFIRNHPHSSLRASAYWGLGATNDLNDKDTFLGFLLDESTRETIDEFVIWQILIGLNNFGEPLLYSNSEAVQNFFDIDGLAAIREYLSRCNANIKTGEGTEIPESHI